MLKVHIFWDGRNNMTKSPNYISRGDFCRVHSIFCFFGQSDQKTKKSTVLYFIFCIKNLQFAWKWQLIYSFLVTLTKKWTGHCHIFVVFSKYMNFNSWLNDENWNYQLKSTDYNPPGCLFIRFWYLSNKSNKLLQMLSRYLIN